MSSANISNESMDTSSFLCSLSPSPIKADVKRIAQPTSFSSPTLLKNGEVTVGISSTEYEHRRTALFSKMSNQSVLILSAAPMKFVSPDIAHKYRQDPNFFYLTGFLEPNAVCVLYKESKSATKFYLFCEEFNASTITWQGHITGTKCAKKLFHADDTFDIAKDMNKTLANVMKDCMHVYFDVLSMNKTAKNSKSIKYSKHDLQFTDIHLYEKIEGCLLSEIENRKSENYSKCLKLIVHSCGKMIERLRMIKSNQELNLLRTSGAIASHAMSEVIQNVSGGEILEDRLAAIFEFGCRMRGSARLSAPVTISHGSENNILHYLNNDRVIKSGTLCLMDSGAEYYGYASDITRVFPASGTFTTEQLAIYNIVLSVQKHCIQLCTIGHCIAELDALSAKMLAEGLQELGIISENGKKKKIDKMWHSGGVHFVAHFIGLDIHDTPSVSNRVKFQSGMCIALEPGIYLPADERIPKEYQNIGIRIEDTIHITDNDPEIFTKCCTKEPERIMELMEEEKDHNIWKCAKEGLWSPRSKKFKRQNARRNLFLCKRKNEM